MQKTNRSPHEVHAMTEESLFAAALEKATAAERQAFLEQACGADAALLQRLKVLLAAHDKAHGIFDGGADDPAGSAAFDLQPTAAPPEQVLAVGAVVAGRYKVLETLGEGGMGTVFVAEQTQPVRRKVALKLIKAGMDSTRVLARFEAERQALALMDHPHIAKVLDGGLTETGRPYFVMEYIKGVPLTAYCDAARLTVRQRLELFIPVCQAVQHAHQKGIIHRDLKPSNILVALYDGKPVPKVIDFGLAKAMHQPLTERTLYTAHEMVLGTPLYMSPEQAELNNLDIDTRADIYALGVILYELLTGATPLERRRFKKAAWNEILRIIREEEPAKPSTRLSGSSSLPALAAQRQLEPAKLARLLRGDLDWIVMKALEKDRNRRYETANGFGMDVQRYLAEEPVLAGPPTASYRLRKFLRRNRRAVLATSVLLVALLGGIAGTTWGLVRAVRAETEARVAERDEKEEARAAEVQQRRDAERQRQEAVEQTDRAEKAEREAKEQADIALAVNDFLQKDLLGQADVANQPLLVGGVVERNPNVTVRELLDRAAREIAGKFTDQPLTEASIRLTIGDAYLALGRYAEAQQHLERSVQLRTARLGADHPDTMTSKNDLAELYQVQGHYAKAETLIKEVLEVRTAKLGADHPDTLTAKNHLAALYMNEGRYPKAEQLFKEVLEVRTAKLGADHPATLTSKHNLATAVPGPGAVRPRPSHSYKEVLEVRTAKLGADHPDTLTSKNNLAALYRVQGQYAKAEPLFKEVLEARTAKLGAGHPHTLISKNNLALLYQAQGQYAKAEPLFRQAVDGLRNKVGLNHANTQTAIRNLVDCYDCLKAPEKAEPLLRELAEFWKDKAGADSLPFAGQLASLGLNLLQQRKALDAEHVLRDCLAIRQNKVPDDWTTFNTKSALGGALLAQKKFADAEPLLLKGYEGMKQRDAKIPPQGKVRLTEALERLVQLYDATGQKDKVQVWRKKLEAAKDAPKPAVK